MKKLLPLLLIFTNALVYAQMPLEKYEIDSASVEHPGVPKYFLEHRGNIGFTFLLSIRLKNLPVCMLTRMEFK